MLNRVTVDISSSRYQLYFLDLFPGLDQLLSLNNAHVHSLKQVNYCTVTYI